MKKRTRYEIYLDVLDAVRRRGAVTITSLSYSAQLPVDGTKSVVSFLSFKRFAERITYVIGKFTG